MNSGKKIQYKRRQRKQENWTVKGDYNEDELTYTKWLCREQKEHMEN